VSLLLAGSSGNCAANEVVLQLSEIATHAVAHHTVIYVRVESMHAANIGLLLRSRAAHASTECRTTTLCPICAHSRMIKAVQIRLDFAVGSGT
jgi:hypothetical protein